MIILGTNSIKDTGYEVANSIRFNDGSSDSFNRTPSSAGSTRLATFSFWLKRGHFGITPYVYMVKDGSNNQFGMHIDSNDKLVCFHYNGSSYDFSLTSTSQFRDPSAWYHFVIKIDTANGTAIERLKLFVNGVYDPWNTTISQNFDGIFLKDASTYIGSSTTPHAHYDGYFAEYVVIDGTALEPTSFGEFDEDSPTIWKPIDVSGLTFGTNGFYLDFEDSSSLGNDAAGSNNFSVNNLTAVDQSTDTCTNNFCTMNPLDNYWQGSTFANGNNTVTTVASKENYNTSTLAIPSNDAGKYYCEVKIVSASAYSQIGLADKLTTSATDNFKNHAYGYAYDGATGNILNNDSGSSYGNSYTTDDIIGIAVDTDNNKLYFSKNGTFQNSGDPTSGATGTGAISLSATTTNGYYMFASGTRHNDSLQVSWNFGSPPFAISSGNTDGNGYGNFEYAVPSGYYSLNTKNLSEYG